MRNTERELLLFKLFVLKLESIVRSLVAFIGTLALFSFIVLFIWFLFEPVGNSGLKSIIFSASWKIALYAILVNFITETLSEPWRIQLKAYRNEKARKEI